MQRIVDQHSPLFLSQLTSSSEVKALGGGGPSEGRMQKSKKEMAVYLAALYELVDAATCLRRPAIGQEYHVLADRGESQMVMLQESDFMCGIAILLPRALLTCPCQVMTPVRL